MAGAVRYICITNYLKGKNIMGMHATKTQYTVKVTLKGEVDEGIIKDAAEWLYVIAYQRNLEPNDIKVEQLEHLTRVSTLYSIEAEDEQRVLSEEEQERELRMLEYRIKCDFESFSEKHPGLEVKASGKTVRIYEKIPFCEFCQKKDELRAMQLAPSFRRSPETAESAKFRARVESLFTTGVPQLPTSSEDEQRAAFLKYLTEQQQAAWDARTGY